MSIFSNFSNSNHMSREKKIEHAIDITSRECRNEIRNVLNGMIRQKELHDYVRNGGDHNVYIDFLRDFTNSLDRDDEKLQVRAKHFYNTYLDDSEVRNQTNSIIKLYSLIIDLNTSCKNYCICEYQVLEAIFNARSEAEAKQQVLSLREKSNYFLKMADQMLNQIVDINDHPHKVLSL